MTTRRPADRPVYFISIAAQLADVHPRTLRIYEGASDILKLVIAANVLK